MRKTQVALAALALVASTAAMAADVSIGGYVEAAVQKTTDGTQMIGGGLDINKIYVSASEEIEGGWKAGAFALLRFEIGTGTLTRPGASGGANDGTLFEIANVNLGHASVGTMEFGRTVDSYWGNGVAAFDVTGGSNLGSAVSSVLNLQTSKIFIDNSIHYVSPTVNGITVAGTYAVQTSTTGSTIGLTAKGDRSYTVMYNAGALNLGAGAMESDLTKGNFVGAGYDFGVAKVNVIYQKATDVKSYGLNTAIPLTGALTATAGFYRDSGDTFLSGQGAGRSNQVGLLYALSKRTRVYANYQRTTGELTTNLGLSTVGANAPVGSAFTVGVGHSF